MKYTKDIIYSVALLALLTVYFIETRSNLDSVKAKDAEMKAKIREKQKEFDALKNDYELRGDSIQTAFNTIKIANLEKQKAFERTQLIIKNYEKILYVRFDSDSARSRELSKLYPSLRNN